MSQTSSNQSIAVLSPDPPQLLQQQPRADYEPELKRFKSSPLPPQLVSLKESETGCMLDSGGDSGGSGCMSGSGSGRDSASIYMVHKKLEERIGGILCCTVCLDLPKTAIYQVRRFTFLMIFRPFYDLKYEQLGQS
jgi:hypothetical protein